MFHKKPKLNIIDETYFDELDKDCQKLVIKAEKGDFKSLISVAKGFIYGKNNFPINSNLGLRYLQFGAEKENTESLKLYGRYLLQGEIIEQNETEAINILNNVATKTKNASLKLELAEIILSHQSFDINSTANYNVNYPLAKQLYKDAADLEDLHGMTRYAQFCLKTKTNRHGTIEPNYSEAQSYFKKAASKGDSEAMFRYGELFELGVPDTPVDIATAKSWYKKSFDAGNLGGYAKYGYTLISSKYGETDEPEGYRLIKYSSDHGNAIGMLAYASIIQKGLLLTREDKQRAYELIKKAAETGEPSVINAMGMVFEYGIHVAASSYIAVKCYKLAHEEGSFQAINRLGEVYLNGGDGFSRSLETSTKYYKIGADAGMPLSIFQYCKNLYEDKKMLLNIYEIRKYLEKGRRLKCPGCIVLLGNMYLKGDLFPKKTELGEMFVKEAAEMGDMEAMQRFVDIYDNEEKSYATKPPEYFRYKDILDEKNKSKACLLI